MSAVSTISPSPLPRRLHRRQWWLGALVLIAGCAGTGPREVATTAPAPVAAPAPPPAPPPRLPTAEAVNRVAVLVPLSGGSAAVGQSIANAARLAMADLGEKRFTLSTYDTAGPGGATAAAQQAIAGGAGIILGPLLAPDARAAGAVARAGGVPVLSFSNDVAVAGGGVWVLGFQPAQAVTRLVNFARGRGVERFAALVPAGTYGQRVSTAYLRGVENAGGRVTGVVNYTRNQTSIVAAARKVTDYDGRLARAQAARPTVRPDGTVAPVAERIGPVPFQALLVADTGRVASTFQTPLGRYGVRPGTIRLLGTELWAAEPGLARAPGMAGAWFAAVPDARFNTLAQRYAQRFGGRPSRLASLGYDSVLLVGALADRWAVGRAFPAAQLTDDGGFAGIDGVFRLRDNGIVERGFEVRQVGSGGISVVAPAPTSFGAPVALLLQ